MNRMGLLLVIGVMMSFGCNTGQKQKVSEVETNQNETEVKNIILMIGDGMGLSQVSSAFYFNGEKPNFMRFTTIGLINTSSSKEKITDSAAGATAFACGEKTYNGAIGVDDNGNPINNIVEVLSERGKKTGLIATSSITHATPASFYAHARLRKEEELIASQMHTSEVDFFAGGGIKYFSKRSDEINYLDSLEHKGFKIDTSALKRNELNANHKYGYLLADGGMPRMMDGRGDFLSEATQMSIDYLSKADEGFFLMVEGSQIDWGGHANDAEYVKTEVLDFDKAIGVALDFAAKNGNTLVVVTADHETGGFSLAANNGDYNDIKPTFSTGGHTTTLIPVFAYGPSSQQFGGIYQNAEIFHKMIGAIPE